MFNVNNSQLPISFCALRKKWDTFNKREKEHEGKGLRRKLEIQKERDVEGGKRSSLIKKHALGFLPLCVSFSLSLSLFRSHDLSSHPLVISGERWILCFNVLVGFSLPYMCVCHASHVQACAPLECTRGRIAMHLARAVSSTGR